MKWMLYCTYVSEFIPLLEVGVEQYIYVQY